MKKFRLTVFAMGFGLAVAQAQATTWDIGRGWTLYENEGRASPSDAQLCHFWSLKIFAPTEEISCSIGTRYVVNLKGRTIFYDTKQLPGRDQATLKQYAQTLTDRLVDGGFEKLEELRTKQIETQEKAAAAEKAEKHKAKYIEAFESANTTALINDFENRYANDDPEGLIPKLANKKIELKRRDYQAEFAKADTASKLSSFIARYSDYDPDGLVTEARTKLPRLQKTELAEQQRRAKEEQEENDRIEREKLAEKNRKTQQELAKQIGYCNQLTVRAQDAMKREKEIGAVSGYVNTRVMREAGEVIVSCREMVPKAYQAYRKAGGTKALNELP